MVRLAVLLTLLTACSSKPASDGTEALLGRMTAFRDEMCKCTDKACAVKTWEAIEAWAKQIPKPDKPRETPPAMAKKMTAVTQEYVACYERLVTEKPPATTGPIPECEDYMKVVAELQQCERVSPETRKSTADSYVKVASTLIGLDEEQRRKAAANCREIAGNVRKLMQYGCHETGSGSAGSGN